MGTKLKLTLKYSLEVARFNPFLKDPKIEGTSILSKVVSHLLFSPIFDGANLGKVEFRNPISGPFGPHDYRTP